MLPALLVLLRVVLHVIPHSPHLAPVGATAVFAGRTLAPGKAVVLLALAMFLGARLHGYAAVSLVTPFLYPRWVLAVV
jgi:hypothetical protein